MTGDFKGCNISYLRELGSSCPLFWPWIGGICSCPSGSPICPYKVLWAERSMLWFLQWVKGNFEQSSYSVIYITNSLKSEQLILVNYGCLGEGSYWWNFFFLLHSEIHKTFSCGNIRSTRNKLVSGRRTPVSHYFPVFSLSLSFCFLLLFVLGWWRNTILVPTISILFSREVPSSWSLPSPSIWTNLCSTSHTFRGQFSARQRADWPKKMV